jgi:ketosteroid isomerase-like protein
MLRTARAIVLGLSVVLAAACRSTHSSSADVRAVLDAQQDAWNRGEVEQFLRAGYRASPELTFYSGGDVVRGFDEMLRRFLERYQSAGKETGRLDFSDVEVVLLGTEHALARGRWLVDFQAQDDQAGLFTLVLERRPEGWRIVHDHTSLGPVPERKVR